jgi:hypothetical protein
MEPTPMSPEQLHYENLFAQLRRGANWFNVVAGFSLVNLAIQFFQGGVFFVVGLGSTLLADSIAAEMASQNPALGGVMRAVSLGFSLLVPGLLFGIAWLARSRYTTAFVFGMFFYALDGLVFLLFQDWLSIAFHGFALWGMFSGLTACWKLNAAERQAGSGLTNTQPEST